MASVSPAEIEDDQSSEGTATPNSHLHSPAAGEVQETVSLLHLPDEALQSLLSLLVASPSSSSSHRDGWAHLAQAAQACAALRRCAAAAWKDAALALLDPGTPLLGEMPRSFRSTLASGTALRCATWLPAPEFAPPATFAATVVTWDGRLYLFGGRHAETYSADVHCLDLLNERPCWVSLPTRGHPPSARRAHTAVVHGGRMWVLGGGVANAAPTRGDHLSLGLGAPHEWRQETSPHDWARWGHSCVCAVLCEAEGFLVMGGAWQREEARFTVDTRLLWRSMIAGGQWRDVAASGDPPTACYRHAACRVRHAGAEALAVWGGYALEPVTYMAQDEERLAMNAPTTLHLLGLPACSWSSPRTRGVPPEPRGGHSMTRCGDKLLIFGGGQLTQRGSGPWFEVDLDGVHVLDIPSLTFGECELGGTRPEPRGGHTSHLMVRDGQLVVLVLGGRDYPASASRNAQLGRAEAHWLALGTSCGLDEHEQQDASGQDREPARPGGGGAVARAYSRPHGAQYM